MLLLLLVLVLQVLRVRLLGEGGGGGGAAAAVGVGGVGGVEGGSRGGGVRVQVRHWLALDGVMGVLVAGIGHHCVRDLWCVVVRWVRVLCWRVRVMSRSEGYVEE